MPRSSTVTVLTDDMIITPDIHDAVLGWFKDRMASHNTSDIAREVGIDASFFRKVLNGMPVNKPLRLNDETVRRLSVVAERLGRPLLIKVKQ